ncbi:MAG: aminoglycoside phosphotransferase family protein [Thermomicrobiales bacterium]
MPERAQTSPIESDEVFADGNMTAVVRRGNEVRRGRTPWAGTSHAVLRHLEAVGIPWSPRYLGADGGIDRYSFVPGETAPADLAGYRDDAILVEVGQMIRAYHDAMVSFTPPSGVSWPVMPGMPPSDGTICHNDIAPWNVVFQDGSVSGLIDWDLVAPATRAWDLAYAAWRFAPLYPAETFGSVADRIRRVHLLLDAYGMTANDRADFPEIIIARMRSAFDVVEQWGAVDVPGFDRLYRGRMHVDALDHIAWTETEFRRVWYEKTAAFQ